MKPFSNKTLVAGGLTLLVTVFILTVSKLSEDTSQSLVFWPKFELKAPVIKEQNPDGFSMEKLSQTQMNRTDMRSDLYLTHHRYLLENIAKMEVTFRHQTYTLNDVCYKPHAAIFEKANSGKKPHYMERLFLEMKRLSPCLIVTPLNCFYDSYLIHSQISRWNQSTDYLNRRLREAYIEGLKEGEPRVYVKSTYGPDMIQKWSRHMFNLASINNEKEVPSWSESVKRWISSIEPRRKICADPMRSCDETLDAENYFNICMVMQHMNNFEEKRRQRLKFSLDKNDEEFTTRLDCVDDREKFIEWMKERELRGILRAFEPAFHLPDHHDIVNQRCNGIYHDTGSDGIEFFDGALTFTNKTMPFDTIRTGIALITPINFLKARQHVEFVNGHESVWTLERAEQLLEEFRYALRNEVDRFNEHRASKKVGVTSRVSSVEIEKEAKTEQAALYFVIFATALFLIMLSCFGWTVNPLQSLAYLLFCFASTATFYIWVYNQNGVLVLDEKVLYDFFVFLVLSTCLTYRNSLLRTRLERSIQRWNPVDGTSNFSSLNTVGSLQSNPRRLWYVLDKYMNFQTAQDIDSNEPFEKMRTGWWAVAALLAPSVFAYWYFVDSNIVSLFVTVTPSILIFTIDEYRLKEKFRTERKRIKTELKKLFEDTGCIMSAESLEELFARGGVPQETSEMKEIYHTPRYEVLEESPGVETKKSRRTLLPLSASSYDVSRFMTYPNNVVRKVRLTAVQCYFALLSVEGFVLHLSMLVVGLLSIAAFGGLFFPMVSRIADNINNFETDDFSIDIEISNFTMNWEKNRAILSNFTSDLDSIPMLRVVSSWEKSFERFEERMTQNDSFLFASNYSKWIEQEPISWAITAPRTSVDYKNRLPDPFQFRLLFELINCKNEDLMIEYIQKLNDIIAKYSRDISMEASGLVYEHYHQAVVWISYPRIVIPALIGQFAIVFLIGLLFATTTNLRYIAVFTVFFGINLLGTNTFISAFELGHGPFYIRFASVVAFLVSWTPFCELCRFRNRILLKEKHRTCPEQRIGRRIRLPFIAFIDNCQFFGISITVCILLTATCAVVPQFNSFLLPTVILIGVQIFAVLYATLTSIVTRLMFERKVIQALRRDLAGNSTAMKVHGLTHKRALTPPYSPPEFELNVIEPAAPEGMFWAPPPKFPKGAKSSSGSEDGDKDEEDNQPGPSTSSSQANRLLGDSGVGTEKRPPGTKRKRRPVLGMNLPSAVPLAREPWHYTLCGAPFDGSMSYESVQAAEEFYASGDHDEHPMEADEQRAPRARSSSSEEDVMSRGDPDEELLASQEALHERWRLARAAESLNLAAANNRGMNADDSQQGPNNQNQPRPILREDDSDDEPAGLNATPSPPRVDVVPAAHQVAQHLGAPPAQGAARFAIIEEARRNQNVPRIVQRVQPRDPLREPPIMIEFIQEYDRPDLPRHPRANQYPPNWNYAMVAFAEDRYWTERVVPLPPGVRVPPRPYDYWDIRETTPPPEDFNWVPPPEAPPIPIPPEAYALFEERRREHFRQLEEGRRPNENPDPEV